ncbi:hypothetical protein FLL61_15955 [Vibrio cholerae]|nr:hypothetical protein FLL61_15955 [Vibrio cholerae]
MVTVGVFEFCGMRCQPLRRALTLSHASVKTSPFVTERYRVCNLRCTRCTSHIRVGYFLEVQRI